MNDNKLNNVSIEWEIENAFSINWTTRNYG